MKQSDTNAIANLYVESINRGADPSKMSHQTHFKISDMVNKLKRQGVSLEDAILQISQSLEMGENTNDLEETIKEMWTRRGGDSVALRMRGQHPDQLANPGAIHTPSIKYVPRDYDPDADYNAPRKVKAFPRYHPRYKSKADRRVDIHGKYANGYPVGILQSADDEPEPYTWADHDAYKRRNKR